MKAPKYAYIQDAEGDFFKWVIEQGGQSFVSFVARYFQGERESGGYSTTAEDMKLRTMALFALDDIMDVAVRDSNGVSRVIGFIGFVAKGSLDGRHNMEKRSSGLITVKGGRELVMLNDAGLNVKPRISFEMLGEWANWVQWRVSYYGGMYGTVDEGGFTADYFGLSNAFEKTEMNEEKSLIMTFTDPSDNPALTAEGYKKYDAGINVSCSAWARNEEGESSAGRSFSAKERVMYPRGLARKYPNRPTAIDDTHSSADFDMYEEDYLWAKTITATGNISGPYVYAAPSGSRPPLLDTPLGEGWYYFGFGGSEDKLLAFQVDATGKIVASTEIDPATPSQPTISIAIQIGTDRQNRDCYAIEYTLTANQTAIDFYNKIRVTMEMPTAANSLYHGFQAYNPDGTMYSPRASGGSAHSIVLSTDGTTLHVVRGLYKDSAGSTPWLDLLSGNPDGSITDVNELSTAVVEAYCTVEGMEDGSTWKEISNNTGVIRYPKNYVSENLLI